MTTHLIYGIDSNTLIVLIMIGIPSRGVNCFGRPPPNLCPEPPAGIITVIFIVFLNEKRKLITI